MNTHLHLPQPGARFEHADILNRGCFCLTLPHNVLSLALDTEVDQPSLSKMIRQRCPHLFAAQPLFVSAIQLEAMARVVQAVESVVASPAYQEQVLATAPAGPRAVCRQEAACPFQRCSATPVPGRFPGNPAGAAGTRAPYRGGGSGGWTASLGRAP